MDTSIGYSGEKSPDHHESPASRIQPVGDFMIEEINKEERETVQAEIEAAQGVLDKPEKKCRRGADLHVCLETQINDKENKQIGFKRVRDVCGKHYCLENDRQD